MADQEDEGAAAPAPQNIVVHAGVKLHLEQFKEPDEPRLRGPTWLDWIEEFEEEVQLQKVPEADWLLCLKRYGGKEIRHKIKYSKDPPALDPPAEETDYQKMKRKLTVIYSPSQNKFHGRTIFNRTKQREGESTCAYAARLREKAEYCEFQNYAGERDDRILERLTNREGYEDFNQRAISKKWGLDKYLVEADARENLRREMKEMKTELKIAKLSGAGAGARPKKKTYKPRPRYQHQKSQDRLEKEKPEKRQEKKGEPYDCTFCGKRHTYGRCPAYGKTCLKCHRKNHFAVQCGKFDAKNDDRGTKKFVKRATWEEEEHDTTDTESDDSTFLHSLKLKQIKISTARSGQGKGDTVQLFIHNTEAHCELDSGASANVMDVHQFRALKKREPRLELRESEEGVCAIQKRLEVIGEFDAVIRNQNRGVQTKFIVIGGKIDSPPLISRATSEELGMLKIDTTGSLREENDLKIKKIKAKDLLEEYSDVFTGIGPIKEPNGEVVKVKLQMEEDASPVAQRPRPVAYHLKEPLKEWLEQGEQEEIFERVPENEAITWCSPLVVQPKPKFVGEKQLKSHMIRASIDMRIPNESMKRSRCVQAPVLDDFTYAMHDCRVFSKLDLRQGYHQLTIDEETAKVATFSTPWGNYRARRLVFGAKSSQDVFDATMHRIFGDIRHCVVQRDDLLLGGENTEAHRKTLREVFERARAYNVSFNKEKCEFEKDEITFFGHTFTNKGLQADPEKVRALQECKPPESKEEVRSLLGMTGYLSYYIPGYAVLTAPLRELTRQDVKFQWKEKEEKAFESIKGALTSERTMAYFDPDRPTVLRTEASFKEGISAGLFQQVEGRLRPVQYISRSFTDTETRYSQTEKDCLAAKWATERLRLYLGGAPRFKIITGHKPLVPMLMKATARLPPRIEKWVMAMQDLDFSVEYQPGKDEQDPMDYLSRHPLPETGSDRTEKVVRQVRRKYDAVLLEELQEATEKELQPLIMKIEEGRWNRKDLQDPLLAEYYDVRDELSIINGLVYRQERVVVPEELRQKVVKVGHSLGHLGKTKTKQLLREKYWFPGMTTMVETCVEQCYECRVATKEDKSEPIKATEIPGRGWEVVSMDFGGPYPDGHYNMVLIDKRTRYPVVEEVSSTSFDAIHVKMKGILSTYGTPRRIETDNGPPFNSSEFADFARTEGFYHHRITPLHPRANGEAERFMRPLNKTEQIAHLQKKNSKERMISVYDMLTSYRATPHPATGVAPYRSLHGREIRTKLDYQKPEEERSEEDQKIDQRDRRYKKKMTEDRENKTFRKTVVLLGDFVLVRQQKRNKWTTPYEPTLYEVIKIAGSQVTARRFTDGRIVCRDAKEFKVVNSVVNTLDEVERDQDVPSEPNWVPEEIPADPVPRKKMGEDEPKKRREVPPTPSGTDHETQHIPDADIYSGNQTPLKSPRPARDVPRSPQPDRDVTATPRPRPNQGETTRTTPVREPDTRDRRPRRKPAWMKDYVV